MCGFQFIHHYPALRRFKKIVPFKHHCQGHFLLTIVVNIRDSIIDHTPIKEIFNIEFQRVGDYIQKAVPKVKAALAQQAK